MGIATDVIRVAASTSTGNQTFTGSLGGLTPKAAVFFISTATANDTNTDERVLSYGAATGTSNEWCIAQSSQHNVGTTVTFGRRTSTYCIEIINTSDGSVDGHASFVSFGANAVTVNWSDAPASAYLVTVILFAGSDLSAHANVTASLGNSVDNTLDVTQPGFEPDIVIAACSRQSTDDSSAAAGQPTSYGFAHNDGIGGISQYCTGISLRNARSSGTPAVYNRSDAAAVTLTAVGALDWYAELGSFDSSGFTVTTRNAGANGQSLHYLALNLGGAVDSWVGSHTSPTSTGNDAETGPGMTPQLVMMLPTMAEAYATSYADSRGGTAGISVFDADAEFCTTGTSEDAAATTNTQSFTDSQALNVPDDDGTTEYEGVFVSFDTNGWTVNYTTAPATAKVIPALVIEEESASGISGTLTKTLGALTLSSEGDVALDGQLSATLGAATLSGVAELDIDGQLSSTLGAATLASTGELDIDGQLSATLGAATLSGVAELDIDGATDVTLGALSLSATGELDIDGTLAETLGALTLESEGSSSDISGQLDSTLGALTVSSVGALTIDGQLAETLGAATLVSVGELDIEGTLAETLGALLSTAQAELAITGTLGETLGVLTLSSTGVEEADQGIVLEVDLEVANVLSVSRGIANTVGANLEVANVLGVQLEA